MFSSGRAVDPIRFWIVSNRLTRHRITRVSPPDFPRSRLMKFNCPVCHQLFSPENINVQTDLALCKACGNVTPLSTLADGEFDADVLQNPPKGTWFHETMSESVVGATTRHPIAFFLVPFMCVWAGGSLGGIYGTQIAKGEFNLMMSLFGLPFLIGSIVFGSIALMAVCGKVEIRIREGAGQIFVGVGPVGWNRSFQLDEVDAIESRPTEYIRHRPSHPASLLLRGGTPLRFGTTLTEPRRHFILSVLRQEKARRGGKARSPPAPTSLRQPQ